VAQCFIDDFNDYAKYYLCPDCTSPIAEGERIHGFISDFLKHKKFRRLWGQDIGFSSDGSHVRWVTLRFITNLPKKMASHEVHPWVERWDEFIDLFNNAARGTSVGTVFHTSYLWVRADFETRLVGSTLLSATASVLFALLTVFLFLGNLALAVYLVLSILCVVICLAGFLFAILGWSLGAVEALALIIVVGLSVDYSLHMAEGYNRSPCETRYLRVQDALRRNGGALVGASATSVLACPPILFCTIQVFVQFGVTIICNLILSLLFSVGFFSALLIIIGPMDDFGSCRAMLYKCNRMYRGVDESTETVVVGTVLSQDTETLKPRQTSTSDAVGGVASGYRWSSYELDETTKKKPAIDDTNTWHAPQQPDIAPPVMPPTTVRTPTRAATPTAQSLGKQCW